MQVCVSFQCEQTIVSHSFYMNKHRLILLISSVAMFHQYNSRLKPIINVTAIVITIISVQKAVYKRILRI